MSKGAWTAIIVIALVVIIGGVWMYANKPTGGGTPSTNPPATGQPPGNKDAPGADQPVPATGEPIKIGAILPLTGYAAEYGKYMQQGLMLAEDQINAAGGVKGRPLQVLFEDSAADPKTGLAAANKLVSTTDAKVFLTSVSGVTLALLPLANENDILVMTSSTHPEVTAPGNLAVRNYFTSAQEGEMIADFAINQLGLKRVALIHLDDEGYGAYGDAIAKRYAEEQAEVVAREKYTRDTSDFRGILTKVKAADPDVIFLGGWGEIALIVKQAREIGLDCKVVGSSTFETPNVIEVGGDSVNGVYFTAPLLDKTTEVCKNVFEKYNADYGSDPDFTAIEFYDSLMILAKAINESSTLSGAAIRDTLISIEYDGVMGHISYKPNGDVVYPVVIKTIENGQFVAATFD